MTLTLKMVDRPGVIPVETMRRYFEDAVTNTRPLASSTPLGVVSVNGEFSHYADEDTDTLWLGFALGMRAAERIAKATADEPPLTPSPSAAGRGAGRPVAR